MLQGPRVVVVRFGSLGDVVLATALPQAVRRRHAGALVTFVTRLRYADVLLANPAVDRVVGMEPGESVSALARRLSGERFDVGLDLQRSLRSRRLRQLVPARWGLADTSRVARLGLVWLGRAPREPLAVPRRYLSAARVLDVEPDGDRPELFLTDDDRARAAAIAPTGCVALAPGATWASKRWSPERWCDLARRLCASGRHVIALGTVEERALLDDPAITPAYGLPLRVAAVLERARVLVAHDSGMLHLAAAVGTPVVALFGPTVTAQGFVPDARVRVVERALPCRPCSPFGSAECPLGHHRCMRGIEVEPVAAAVEGVAA